MTVRMTGRRLRGPAVLATAVALLAAALTAPAPSAAAGPPVKYLGIFRQADPVAEATGTAGRYGVTPASVLWFDSWASGNAFDVAAAKSLWSQGVVPHFTWEPWDTSLSATDSRQIHLQDIVDGRWDSYIRARGAEFAATGAPLMVRWGHEFNGNWYPWGITANNGDPALYIAAYRHVHDLVRAAGATNVQWVWCFNDDSSPDASYNDPAQSYPGDGYVDWVAIDGYNWGFGPSWDPTGDHWRSFDAAFAGAYAKARAIAPHRPVMIAEAGSSEDGGDKAQWISDMSSSLQSGRYPDLQLIVYFDQDKEELWSGTSSPATQAAFTSWVNQPFMRGTGADLARVVTQYEGTTGPTTPTPTVTSAPPATACTAGYRTVSSWGGGYQAEVTVSAGAAAVNGWTVRWNPAAAPAISQLWNGTLSTAGSSVTVTNAAWNGSLGPHATTTFGFVANGTPATPALSCTSP